jgi:hypothetical protein
LTGDRARTAAARPASTRAAGVRLFGTRAARVRAACFCVCVALAAGAPGSSAAADSSGPRLVGTFVIAGRITDAVNIPDEHRGDAVLRSWVFVPTCPAGSCRFVRLMRQRVGGVDTIVLRRISSVRYAGSGSFYAPVQCSGTTYPRGERVPFTLAVHVTATVPSAGGPVAARVNATYASGARRNLTSCVELPAHDAAKYHGHVVAAPPP